MNLQISQILLEGVRFGHVGDFLGQKPSANAASHSVNFEVQLLDVKEVGKGVVRLKAKSGEGPQYTFEASYLVLFSFKPDNADPEFPKKLAATGAIMLMPMVRELVGNLTMRGRFGQVWLPPVDFTKEMGAPLAPKRPKQKPKKGAVTK
jgi:preprotein translocase subunit SecB